jgi:sugar phosphate isomerase/epimerase
LDLVANAKALSASVDDIELVLFESDGRTNLPDPKTVQTLRSLALSTGLSYTVHMPGDVRLASESASLRRRSIEQCIRVFEMTLPLEPFAYIVHFEGDQRGSLPSTDMTWWVEGLEEAVEKMLQAGLPPERICVENLDYPFELVERTVLGHNLCMCLDIGHILFYDYGLEDYLDRYAQKTRVFHLHGIRNGEDHHDIRSIPASSLSDFLGRLSCWPGPEPVVTVEVFDEDDLMASLEVLNEAMRPEERMRGS